MWPFSKEDFQLYEGPGYHAMSTCASEVRLLLDLQLITPVSLNVAAAVNTRALTEAINEAANS